MIDKNTRKRIYHLVDHIESNLDRKMKLEHFARIAMFSKFHLFRIFKLEMGETVGQFVKRLRMEQGFRRILMDRAVNIEVLSTELGYSSCTNFSRDFRKFFGMSPTEVKEDRGLSFRGTRSDEEKFPVTFKAIEEYPDRYVAYLKVTKGYLPDAIIASFQELFGLAFQENFNIKEAVGVPCNDPDCTPAGKCIYDTCLVIDKPQGRWVDYPCNFKTLKGGCYAVFRFEGNKHQVPLAWNYIYGKWLVEHNYQLDDIPRLEVFDHTDGEVPEVVKACLCLPVKPLNQKRMRQ
jgi:AraC-type DNA-binding domain-containing proteins